jgi:hypothetical protein
MVREPGRASIVGLFVDISDMGARGAGGAPPTSSVVDIHVDS